MENNDYIPFGDEWKSEMKKLKKEVLIDLLSNALKENLKLKNFKNAIRIYVMDFSRIV